MFHIQNVQRLFFLSLFSLLCLQATLAQDCGCDFTFKPSDVVNGFSQIDGTQPPYDKIRQGNTLCIEAGVYNGLRIINIVGGNGAPVIIKNCGGQVVTNDGIRVLASRYVKLSGAGDASVKYGFKVQKAVGTGVDIKGLSTNIEVENVEVQNTGFAGIMAKTDPECNKAETWRPNFTLQDLKIHDCYIHDTEGEGMYIGHTGGYENTNKYCSGKPMYAHLLKSVHIYNNLIERAGWDGIQINLAVQDTRVYNNTVIGYGTEKELFQNFGFSIGGGTKGRFYSNFIYQLSAYKNNSNDPNQLKGSGVQIISNQDTFFYNNIIVNSERHGIFAHNRLSRHRLDFREGYYFINNTIIGAGVSGIFYNSSSALQQDEKADWRRIFYNNLIVAPNIKYEKESFWKGFDENYIDFNSKELRDAAKEFIKNNIFAPTISEVNFANAKNPEANANNFKLMEGSKAIDAGLDAAKSFGVNADFSGFNRPNSATFDIGAFEYRKDDPVGLSPENTATITTLYPNPSQGRIHLQLNVPQAAYGVVQVMSMEGKKIAQVFKGKLLPGKQTFTWNNAQQHKGMYILHVVTDKQHVSKPFVVR
ncbi:choice-of-anchor Q domain-containing protein [Microscilla marina]|uniref:Secretion system C-terminal sorting domain-containing protein n=1 Tax=Microscilla marina ATCC 23134 TaxID=313606 RepID=A1ZNT1_MICM2|nr:choice-of-anchor Q domain-containing protein [Microscilla marina]EAY27970.1 hypothetical protein M23134_02639 [Microscilla marina ATCC 23134]